MQMRAFIGSRCRGGFCGCGDGCLVTVCSDKESGGDNTVTAEIYVTVGYLLP